MDPQPVVSLIGLNLVEFTLDPRQHVGNTISQSWNDHQLLGNNPAGFAIRRRTHQSLPQSGLALSQYSRNAWLQTIRQFASSLYAFYGELAPVIDPNLSDRLHPTCDSWLQLFSL